MYWIIGQTGTRYLHICVEDKEREEAKRLMKELGYTKIEDQKMKKGRRFRGKETYCLAYLRKEVKRNK